MKLVRDCIPQIIEENGKTCTWKAAGNKGDHIHLLVNGMADSLRDFCENPCYDEAADILEILKGLCYLYDLEFESVISTAVDKWESHGGYEGGIYLEEPNESR